MCQLAIIWIQTTLDCCKQWLRSKPRNYPEKIWRWEFRAHVLWWLMQIVALGCEIAGLFEHTKRFKDDLATIAVSTSVVIIVFVITGLQFQLITQRFLRYKNGFILGGVLSSVSAMLYVVVWILNCRLTYTSYHFSILLLGLPSVVCVVSLVVYLGPSQYHECCRKHNNVPQQEVLLQDMNPPSSPPPTYEEATAEQAQQGHIVFYPDPQQNLIVQPPPYSPRRDPSVQPPPYSQSCSQSPSQQSSSSSSSSSRTLRPRPPSTPRKDTEKKWPRVDYDNDDDDDDDDGDKGGCRVASQRRPRQGKSREGRGNPGKTRSRSRSRSGGRSLGKGNKTRSRERTRSRGAGRSSSRGRRGGQNTKHALEGPRTRSRSLRRRTTIVV